MGEVIFVAMLTAILIVSVAVGWKVRPLVWGCIGLSMLPLLFGIIGFVLYYRDLTSDSVEARDWAPIFLALVVVGAILLQVLIGIGWGLGWATRAIVARKQRTTLEAVSITAAGAPHMTESQAETSRSAAGNSA